jgi:Ca2+-binding RTX toxin-like protein
VGTLALAAGITCCSNPCSGTPGDDRIDGTNSADEVRARAGDDQIDGLNGADTLLGNRGKAYRSAGT